MAEIGADPDQLDSLAAELARVATSLGSSGGRLDRALVAAPWWGPDARRFRVGWQAQRGSLRSAADSLQAAARRLAGEAAGQRAASESTDARLPAPVQPQRSERWQLGVGGGAGIDVGLRGELTIDDLPGPTSRVTLELDAAAGAGTGAGGGVELHGADAIGSEGRADAEASVVSSSGATWVVADDEAPGFARARATEAAIDLVPGMATARSGIQALLGRTPPPPESRTALLGVALGVTAGGALGPLAGRLNDTSTAQVGVRRRGDETSLVLHLEGTGAARLPGLLFGESAPRTGSMAIDADIEVFPAHDGTRTVVITTTSSQGDDAVRATSRITLDDAAAGTVLEDAWTHLRHGDLDTAAERMGDLDGAVESVQVSAVAGEVTGATHGASVTASDGARAQTEVEATHRVIDWRR
jgi:hypothetical protein